MSLPALVAALDLGREAARELARQELRRAEYRAAQPSLLRRLLSAVGRFLDGALNAAAGAAPGGVLGVLALVLLFVGFVAVVLTRLGPLARARSGDGALFDGRRRLTAAQHRSLAEQAADEGRFADAIRERLRAVVRDLEARGVLDDRPGRTAGEVARDGGRALPGAADQLLRGAVVFDETWYGGRPADADGYAVLVEVDTLVSAARAVLA